MNRYLFFLCYLLLLHTLPLQAQSSCWQQKADSLLALTTPQTFNGIVLLKQHGHTAYLGIKGYADRERKIRLKENDLFIIGSVSKQITAVLVLREMEQGHLQLDHTLRRYLPGLKQAWADSVTVRQLLTHTHGIVSRDQALAFRPGTQFAYSNLGYELLSEIAARASGHSFASLSAALFRQCGMQHTFHPKTNGYKGIVKGYMPQANGTLRPDISGRMSPVAAGGFLSNAADMVRWNEQLHGGKLLRPATYQLMISAQPNAIRQHPLFGITYYGLGITTGQFGNTLQLGQTGLTTGFTSMNFYYPATQTSLVILENVIYDPEHLKQTFYHHALLRELLQQCGIL